MMFLNVRGRQRCAGLCADVVRSCSFSVIVMMLTGCASIEHAERVGGEAPFPMPPAKGRYVVAATPGVWADGAWREVTTILRHRYEAACVVAPAGMPEALLPTLRRIRPRYVCFVARPEEAGREYVVRLHRLMRRLDEDPYGDALWAILTGYTAADARRIAERAAPLNIVSGFSSMGPGLAASLGAGFACSETDASKFWTVHDGRPPVEHTVKPDPTAALARAFADSPPDVMQTSGHATEKDWQIGYTVKAGQFRCERGELYAVGTAGGRRRLVSPHPKIYLPMGNCLIGHIPEPDCMATAWMHSGGVHQMFGYTAVTFYGYMGWGVGTYFNDGKLSFIQAFHANSQGLLHRLHREFPRHASIILDSYGKADIRRQAVLHRIEDRDLLGLLWDRDVVAMYGDPAWVARMPVRPRGYEIHFSRRHETFTFVLTTIRDGTWPNRPLVFPLIQRVRDIADIAGPEDLQVTVLDDQILLPLKGAYQAGEEVRLSFRAKVCRPDVTRAGTPPIRLDVLPEAAGGIVSACFARLVAGLESALLRAGENRDDLLGALRSTTGLRRDALAFLIAHMPVRDLQELEAGFLTTHVKLACDAWESAPWHDQVSRHLFEDAILPYANLDETRELWMPDMRERCLPLVEAARTPGAAALVLNKALFDDVGVSYHATKRPKPNQSPAESMAAGYASCTGLSILLVDACRSVGIPARIAGVPEWTGARGNHTWVEVCDGGRWHALGAAESTALGQVWFKDRAANADPGHPYTKIYAVQYRKSPTRFPLVWNLGYPDVHAVDVTASYAGTKPR